MCTESPGRETIHSPGHARTRDDLGEADNALFANANGGTPPLIGHVT